MSELNNKQKLILDTKSQISDTITKLGEKYKEIEKLTSEFPDDIDVALLERVEASTLEVKLHTLNGILKRLILKPELKDKENE